MFSLHQPARLRPTQFGGVKLLTGLILVTLCLGVGGFFALLNYSRSLLESPETRDKIERQLNDRLSRTESLKKLNLKVKLGTLSSSGFLEVKVSQLSVMMGSEPPLNLKAQLNFNVFRGVASFWGWMQDEKLDFELVISESFSQNDKNTIYFKFRLNPWTLHQGLSHMEIGVIELKSLDLNWLNVVWAAFAQGFQAKPVSGEVSGTLTNLHFKKGTIPESGGQQTQVDVLRGSYQVILTLGNIEWESPLFDKIIISTGPTQFQGRYETDSFDFKNPLELDIGFRIKGAQNAKVNAFLFGTGGKEGLINQNWKLRLEGRLKNLAQEPWYELSALVRGGPLALMATGRLLRCEVLPLREAFHVNGPTYRPQCL